MNAKARRRAVRERNALNVTHPPVRRVGNMTIYADELATLAAEGEAIQAAESLALAQSAFALSSEWSASIADQIAVTAEAHAAGVRGIAETAGLLLEPWQEEAVERVMKGSNYVMREGGRRLGLSAVIAGARRAAEALVAAGDTPTEEAEVSTQAET